MADNVTIPATGTGSATPVIAADDVSSVFYQRVKLDGGGDGATVPIVAGQQTAAGSLPVVLTAAQITTLTPLATVAATQSGTWTVQPGNTANTTAWKVDGSAVTQPISAAALPLPALAATSTKQSDGSQKSQVVDGSGNVIGATSNALDVNIKSGSSGLPTGAATSALQTTGNTSLASIDGKITAVNTGAVVVSSSALPSGASTSAKQPALGTAGSASTDVISVQGIASMTPLLANPGTAANWGVYVEDAAETAGGNLSMAGSVRRDTPASSAGSTGDNATVNTNAVGALWATLTPAATGGWDTFMATSADGSTALTNSAQSVKGSAGVFGGYYIYNPNASAIYVSVYDVVSGSVTVGTTNPKNSFCIPATSAANLEFTNGVTYGTAISVAATTTGGGNTAPGTALEANFFYK